ncbi:MULTISPECIES: hypothetical protein [Azospirillum]|uniref:hypothetical protein n=1 Tax=Azospirillum TaxID=191 RepID=UPI0012DC929A|nr:MULTISPECIES: hypothetical protein [Azospirillum]MDW7555417.1 hypothetical protein [Azospirillum brasilense]MDW7595175.1 hypothetical protein [Azospirillum brasilense]MDW7630328.1 hypothetical protein [Azospirillum brasilense]
MASSCRGVGYRFVAALRGWALDGMLMLAIWAALMLLVAAPVYLVVAVGRLAHAISGVP